MAVARWDENLPPHRHLQRPLRSRVEETEREVRVLVSARGGHVNDCADAHTIFLSEPLGDRLLIDESDGEPVGVSLNENMPEAPGR